MKLYVNDHDYQLEDMVMHFVANIVPDFQGYDFRHNKSTALFDFTGLNKHGIIYVDIKVRDINPDKFNTYFISADKVKRMRSTEIPCYLVYYFEKPRIIRVYNLSKLPITPYDLKFIHKRAKTIQSKNVFCVPSGLTLEEYETVNL